MLALVHELKPTVVFVAYGRNESYRGEAGLADFRTQLKNSARISAGRRCLLLKTPRPGRPDLYGCVGPCPTGLIDSLSREELAGLMR